MLQDDTLAAQAALEKQLGAVGDDVEDISGKVAEVRCSNPLHLMMCGGEPDRSGCGDGLLRLAFGDHGGAAGATQSLRPLTVQVHTSVKELETNLEDLSSSQQYANEGIYLLCRCAAGRPEPAWRVAAGLPGLLGDASRWGEGRC